MSANQFQLEYTIESISKGELAVEQNCHVETIRMRFKELGVDVGRKNLLTIPQLKAYYDVYGKKTIIRNAG